MASPDPSVSIFTLILSSAFTSAAVNVIWNAISKILDRHEEKKKERLKSQHAYLDVALNLEQFSRACHIRLFDISNAMSVYQQNHNGRAFSNLREATITIPLLPDLSLLPISFVADIKTLISAFDQCDQWIKIQADTVVDIGDAYKLEEERLSYYALQACNQAKKIRKTIGASFDDAQHIKTHFEYFLDNRRKFFVKYNGHHLVIPELRLLFQNEYPTSL